MDEAGFIFIFIFYFEETLLSPGWSPVYTCSFINTLGMARQDIFGQAENTFKKLISALPNNGELLFPPTFRVWLCIFTSQNLAVRISIAISKTDTEGLSRQHCLFLHGKPQPKRTTPAAGASGARRWHTWLQQEIGKLRFSSGQIHPPPTQGFADIQQTGKRGKNLNSKTIHATSMQRVTVPTCSYVLLQPRG